MRQRSFIRSHLKQDRFIFIISWLNKKKRIPSKAWSCWPFIHTAFYTFTGGLCLGSEPGKGLRVEEGEVKPFFFFCAASFHPPQVRETHRHSEWQKRTSVRDLYVNQRTSCRNDGAEPSQNRIQGNFKGKTDLYTVRTSQYCTICLNVSSSFKHLLQNGNTTQYNRVTLFMSHISLGIASDQRIYWRTKMLIPCGAFFWKVVYNVTVRGCNLCNQWVKSERPLRRK